MLVDIVYDLQVKVTDLEISYKSKKKLHLSLYSYNVYHQEVLLNFIILLQRGLGDIAISMEFIHPSISRVKATYFVLVKNWR